MVPFIISGSSIVSKATEYFNGGCYFSNPYNSGHSSWMVPNNLFYKNKRYTIYKKWHNPFFLDKSYPWLLIPSRAHIEKNKSLGIVDYQAEDSIVFDANKRILSLLGPSTLSYDRMKLKANLIALHLHNNTIYAQGTNHPYNTLTGNPIFTYNDLKKDKYGKDGATQIRTFFMDKMRYNIDTKRALVTTLLTKQEASIIKSKQIKKEDESTFYAEDIVYTTCGLAHPHFYIRAKQAKMVQDKQITTGPFRFYFDHVPTPLGSIFGTLFLEGKRTHGIIPPDIGESDDNGFYIRNGGYYINFNDYADISFLGSIYSSGIVELKNALRYKKRYLCSGDVHYGINTTETDKGWSLKWEHKTLIRGPRSLNTNVHLHNKSSKTLDDEDKKIPKKMENESGFSLSYRDRLVGFPYALTLQVKYKNDLRYNFKHWTLPEGSLSTNALYPFRTDRSKSSNYWFHNIQLKHNINFETHFQNAEQSPAESTRSLWSSSASAPSVPKTWPWNHYVENGIKHTIPLTMPCKVFDCINVEPHFTYNEVWYWLNKDTKGPIRVPGFNRIYTCDFGAEIGTTLYYTHYFESATWVQGFRIKTEPSVDFTYTPDFSEKYCQVVEKKKGEVEKEYAFKGLRPYISLANRATSILKFKLHNTVELKVKNGTSPEEKEEKEEKKETNRKIYLLKNLDFKTKYDFSEKEFHLIDGIDIHLASEIEVGKVGKIGFDVRTNFDPYQFIQSSDTTQNQEKRISQFAWNHGQYLGKVKEAQCKVNIDFAHHSSDQKKKPKELLNDRNQSTDKLETRKIDFESPWNLGCEFNWIYKNPWYKYKKNKSESAYERLYPNQNHNKNTHTEKYVTFNGGITLVKKWKVTLSTTYNFTKSKLDPSATDISIQRDLHCWQLSYKWHPLGESGKYDFSLGVKANVLKALKLPRKRTYNKITNLG
ncbi:putative LPS assembly protein LptD [Candidatus Cardinium hertigii]|uniref:putative LPS assembly protein LptD n=1 Tax=Candidatus Cardinium hertigii TaxID=247481 RepID=UPI003D7E0B68